MSDVWEVAKKIEIEGKHYYLGLAEKAVLEELKGIFLYLAGQEEEHFELFLSMQDGKKPSKEEARKSTVIAREAFAKIAAGMDESDKTIITADALKKAVSMETESMNYYQSLLSKVTSPEEKAVVKTILEEEEDHRAVLESIIEFSDGPKEFLDKMDFVGM